MKRLTGVAVLLLLALASTVMAQQAKSWELGVGAGVTVSSGQRAMPMLSARAGYQVTKNLGLSVGISKARAVTASGTYVLLDGPSYITPSLLAAWTVRSESRVSPFVAIGAQITRVNRRWDSARSSWGGLASVGLLVRSSPFSALRIEARAANQEIAGTGSHPAALTVGWSFYTKGCK